MSTYSNIFHFGLSILTTADYCMETTQQLEEKLKEKIDPSLVGKICMVPEQNIFQKYLLYNR